MIRAPRCRGLLGWLFGHKFKYGVPVGYGPNVVVTHCLRCGIDLQRIGGEVAEEENR